MLLKMSYGAAALYMLYGKTSHSLPLVRIGYSSLVPQGCGYASQNVTWCCGAVALSCMGRLAMYFHPVLGGVVDPLVVLQYLILEFPPVAGPMALVP